MRKLLLALLLFASPAHAFDVGYKSIGVNATPFALGTTWPVGPFKMPKTGTLKSVSFYVDPGVGVSSSTYFLGVYDNTGAGGIPKLLLAKSAVATNTTTGWVTLAMTTNPVITGGTLINIAILCPTVAMNGKYDSPAGGTGITIYNDAGGDATFPATYANTTTTANVAANMYATFTSRDDLPARIR